MSPPGQGWEAKVGEAADRVMALEHFKGRERERVRVGGSPPALQPSPHHGPQDRRAPKDFVGGC